MAQVRILLIGPHPPPYGGPNVHMLYLRRYIEARGGMCAALNIGPSRREPVDGALPARSGLEFVVQVARFARRGYRAHHFFNGESPKAIMLALVAAVTARGCGGAYSIGFIGGPEQRYLQRPASLWGRVLRLTLRLAEAIVCNNRLVKQALEPFCDSTTKIHAIETFHAGQVQTLGRVPAPAASFLAGRSPVICTVVSPRHETGDPHHELRMLLGATERLRHAYPGLGCVVLGGADCVPEYQSMTWAVGLSEHFCFAGEVAHPDCLATMARADVFVRAYAHDGSSSSVREALALGVPTLASRNSQHPDAVIQFEPKDAISLSAVLQDVLERLPGIRAALARAEPVAGGEIERELALLGLEQA